MATFSRETVLIFSLLAAALAAPAPQESSLTNVNADVQQSTINEPDTLSFNGGVANAGALAVTGPNGEKIEINQAISIGLSQGIKVPGFDSFQNNPLAGHLQSFGTVPTFGGQNFGNQPFLGQQQSGGQGLTGGGSQGVVSDQTNQGVVQNQGGQGQIIGGQGVNPGQVQGKPGFDIRRKGSGRRRFGNIVFKQG